MDIIEAKRRVLQHLKSLKGKPIHFNELHRAVGCGKPLLIKALEELENEGKIRTYKERGRRYITLSFYVPTYLVALITVTVFAVLFSLVNTSVCDFKVCIDFYSANDVKVIYVMPVHIPILAYVLGVWTAVITFKYKELEDLLSSLECYVRNLLGKA